MWTNRFDGDVFTFARLRYTRYPRGAMRGLQGGYWYSDMPDSDLNLSYRLQQLTSIKVNPHGRIVDLTDKELAGYPWIYMIEPGRLTLEESEVQALRRYLLNGGFMMVDDFWGTPQWENFEAEMQRVFPDRKFVDLPPDHPIFHSVIDLRRPMEELQVPNVRQGKRSRFDGQTWEVKSLPGGQQEICKDVHIRALFDDQQRMIVVACHNTDYGDGWEREGEDDYFFHRFSENIAFPMGINIIFYAMTH